MFIVKAKPIDEILPFIGERVFVVCCEGCREVQYNDSEVSTLLHNIAVSRTVAAVIYHDYVCNLENTKLFLQRSIDSISSVDTILIFSCGVGAQTIADLLENDKFFIRQKTVESSNSHKYISSNIASDSHHCPISIVTGCDTYPLPGYQGLTPPEYDCALCGDCHLNDTFGICPITACAKSLVNGQCGGAKDGMCEVDPSLECGWERIEKRGNRD